MGSGRKVQLLAFYAEGLRPDLQMEMLSLVNNESDDRLYEQ